MFYAAYTNYKGEAVSCLYDNWEQYHEDTFSPLTEFYSLIDFHVHGRTYRERQADLEDTAVRFQHECRAGLSWYELSLICDWFYRNGKRYGLLREFAENGIC